MVAEDHSVPDGTLFQRNPIIIGGVLPPAKRARRSTWTVRIKWARRTLGTVRARSIDLSVTSLDIRGGQYIVLDYQSLGAS